MKWGILYGLIGTETKGYTSGRGIEGSSRHSGEGWTERLLGERLKDGPKGVS